MICIDVLNEFLLCTIELNKQLQTSYPFPSLSAFSSLTEVTAPSLED